MLSQIFCIAQQHVAQWTAFDAYISLDALLLQTWEKHQLESMTYPLRAKSDRILKVLEVPVLGFSSMEEAPHAVITSWIDFVPSFNYHFCKLSDLRSKVFLIDHIEPSY